MSYRPCKTLDIMVILCWSPLLKINYMKQNAPSISWSFFVDPHSWKYHDHSLLIPTLENKLHETECSITIMFILKNKLEKKFFHIDKMNIILYQVIKIRIEWKMLIYRQLKIISNLFCHSKLNVSCHLVNLLFWNKLIATFRIC